MKLTKLCMVMSAIVFFFSPFARAEEMPEKNKAIDLNEVVVRAPRTFFPLNGATLDAVDFQSGLTASGDTANLLRDIPGVNVYNTGGVSSLPVIQGLADDRLRIKVDGMDLIASCPNHMNPALSYIAPAQVDNIRVFAGITPVSLGGDSIGGAIAVSSPEPKFAKLGEGTLMKGEVGSFYRSNGNGFGANLSTTVAKENVSFTYSGTTTKADNYQAARDFKTTTSTGHDGHTLPRDEVGSTAYETWNHAVGFAVRQDNHLMEAKMNYQDIPYQYFPNQRMDMLGNTEYRPSLRYLGNFGWGNLEAQLYYQRVDEHYMNFGDDKRFWYGTLSGSNGTACSPLGTTCAAGMPMYTESDTIGGSFKSDIRLSSRDILRLGSEIQLYRLDDWWPASGSMMWPGTFHNINNGERDRVAVFGEWEKRITSQWVTQTGLRYEHVKMNAGDVTGYNSAGMGNQGRDANNFNASDRDKKDDNLDVTALSQYTLNSKLDFQLGYAHKTRSPNVYERYAWSTWSMAAVMVNWYGDGNGYIGDVNLEPEKANTISATLDFHADDREWEFKATPYYTRVEDYIDAVQWNATTNAPSTSLATNQFTVLKFTNQAAQLSGIDLSGKVPLAKTDFGKFGLNGLLNYTSGKNLDTHDRLYNIMPINTKITFTHELGGWNSGIETIIVADKDDVSAVRNEIKTKGYTLVNLRTSYGWKQVRIDFGIENLFDKYYALPLGGAYVGQGSSMTLNPTDGILSWGTAVPGMGRVIYTGVNLKF